MVYSEISQISTFISDCISWFNEKYTKENIKKSINISLINKFEIVIKYSVYWNMIL